MKIIKDKGFKIYNHKLSTLTTTIMAQNQFDGGLNYETPEIRITAFVVENGFAQSGLETFEAPDYGEGLTI